LDVLKRGEALGALVKAREAGKLRFAGYSGDNEDAVYAAGLPDVAVIETSVNICDQVNITKVLPMTQERGIGVIAKRPVANTAWRAPETLRGIYPEYSSAYRKRLSAMGLKPDDLGFAGEEDWAEIALRFTLSQPGVHTAVIGTTNPKNARANIRAAEAGLLPPEALKKIRHAFREAEKASGEEWPGLT